MAADELALSFLRELGHADEEAAATLAQLDELAAEAVRIRARSRDLQSRFARLPAEQERLRSAYVEANRRLEDSGRELAAAETALGADAGDDRAETSARHAIVRHGDAVTIAERRARETKLELAQAERDAEEVATEAADLTNAAERLAASLHARPRFAEQAGAAPAGDLTGIGDWASGVRAALFVARAALAHERDGLIRQANELAAVLIGEPIVTGAASDVARRVARSI